MKVELLFTELPVCQGRKKRKKIEDILEFKEN